MDELGGRHAGALLIGAVVGGVIRLRSDVLAVDDPTKIAHTLAGRRLIRRELAEFRRWCLKHGVPWRGPFISPSQKGRIHPES